MSGAYDSRRAPNTRRDSFGGRNGSGTHRAVATPMKALNRSLPEHEKHSHEKGRKKHSHEKARHHSTRRRSPSSSSSSSSSSGRRKDKKLQKAHRVMEKHSPAFRKWQEDETKAAKDKELRSQGEALAAIMQSQFKEAIAAAVLPTPAFPPPLPPPTLAPEAAAAALAASQKSPPPGADPATPGPSPMGSPRSQPAAPAANPNKLSKMQLCWVTAELAHEVELTSGTRASFIKELSEALGNRRVVTAVAEFFARHGEGKSIPRKKDERAEAFFDIAISQ
jgi:hypothetical protein